MRPRDLTAAVREGGLRRILRGVYVATSVELTPELRARAVASACGDHVVVCDRTAAWVWGVECFQYRELDGTPPVEAFVLRGREPLGRREVTSGERDLRPGDWVELGGVQVTTPVRTTLDLGCKLDRRDALAAMDGLMREHRFTHRDLVSQLPRYFRRRGCVQLRELVPLVDGRSESPGESWTRLAIHDHGLLAPTPQVWVEIDGVPTYRLDLAYPHARIAVEYDGEVFHGADQRVADEERRDALRRLGWHVVVVRKDDFSDDALRSWLTDLKERLDEAARPPRRWFTRQVPRSHW